MSASAECIKRQDAAPESTVNPAMILVVEDDLALQEAIVDTLELSGLNTIAAGSGEQALECLAKQRFDMVISDVNMGGMDGHQLLDEIKKLYPFLPVLLITAYASIDRSVRAIQAGAVDYLVKPFDPSTLIDLVSRYTEGQLLDSDGPVIASQISRDLFQMAKRVAMTDSTVLISGESGTGKEVIARYIHRHSTRKAEPFIAINCAAIPESMLEATLFGHEKGAFTGAHQSAPGKFEQANGGTLLLDEVSEMDLSLQAKLLRVLQEREVERVGGRKVIALDVRIIATTNRDLKYCVTEGSFREDLFYRLSVFPIRWPALRERLDDVIPLAEYLLLQHAKKMGRGQLNFAKEAEQCLLAYAWPGNVRELDNIVQRALILQPGDTIYANDLLFDQSAQPLIDKVSTVNPSQAEASVVNYSADLKQREYEIIIDALNEASGSKKQAAEKLGISPRTLRYKMAKMREDGVVVD
ncbi:MAG: sigma-54 dependent transcriptional regulator [Pseudomonadales bacterium]|nr:sigma-54 dependent transcriptional regulator [Pseudomonadales bacterium]